MRNSVQLSDKIARAAAILTNAEVDCSQFSVQDSIDGWVQVFIDFTKGSLTNGIFRFYGLGADGTWRLINSPGTLTLTANFVGAVPMCAKGFTQFKCSVEGTGTATSSSATVRYGYQSAGGAVG